MNEMIKAILKSEGLSWAKFSRLNNDRDRSNFKVKVEGWANRLNTAFNAIGYEVIVKKKER